MLPISRILVPVDFSDRCLGMMPYVKAIAARYSAEVALLHVVDPFYNIPATGLSGPVMIPISPSVLGERAKQMDQFAVAELEGLRVRRLVYEGDPVSQIVSFAQAEGAPLIAMPTRGYGVLRRFLIGSVTSKILHDTACPVLTGVHTENLPASGAVRFSNILCAIDLGPQSQEILAWASQLATDFHAKLGIVHSITSLDPGLPFVSTLQFRMELETVARQDVEKLQITVGAESATVHVAGGEPAKAVSTLAESIRADLLVIGRGPQDGSTGRLPTNAYAIIRQSPCPVISV